MVRDAETLALKMEEGNSNHGVHQPLEAGKCKETDSPLETIEWIEVLLTPVLAQ